MSTAHGPSGGRRQLRARLRAARDAAGLTQEQAAEAMDWSLSKLIRIEAGTVSISTNDLKALLQHYRVDDPDTVAELLALARLARQRGWWVQYREIFERERAYYDYVGLEAEAATLRVFQPIGMPGLLQTESYARAYISAAVPSQVEPDDVTVRVGLRLRRQEELFSRPVPPTLQVILDEANLHRHIGGTEVLRDQLKRLREEGRKDHVTLQILPFTAESYGATGQFNLLSFEAGTPDVVYIESTPTVALVDQPAEVETYRQTFARLQKLALNPSESLEMINKMVTQMV